MASHFFSFGTPCRSILFLPKNIQRRTGGFNYAHDGVGVAAGNSFILFLSINKRSHTPIYGENLRVHRVRYLY